MRILLTGSSGFVGGFIFKEVVKDSRIQFLAGVSRNVAQIKNERAGYFAADLTDIDAVQQLMKTVQPTHILHFAGCATVKSEPSIIVNNNVIATQNVLEYAPIGSRFILASSVTVYGNLMNDTSCDEYDETVPTSVYAASKIACEALLNCYIEQGKLSGCSLRFCAVTGPGSTHGIVHDFVKKLRSDVKELEVFGSPPGSCKPILHYADAISAVNHFAFDNHFNGAVNIASNNPVSVEQIARAVMRAVGIFKPIKWLGEGSIWKGDNKQITVNNRLAKDLGWRLMYPDSITAVEDVASGY